MSIDRANLVGKIGTFLIVINIQTHPYIYVQRGRIFLYYILKGYCFVSEILLTPQMTGTKHEDGTTLRLQPYRTAAVVGCIMYMRVASPCYAKASCFRSKQSSVLLLDYKKQTAVDIGADGTTLRSCRPAAVQPPSLKSLQL